MSYSIVELMEVPEEERGKDWLKRSLQSAVKLELATIPPYLCALWSIKEQTGPRGEAYRLIRTIVLEEMGHMGLACNMLTTIGGAPQIIGDVPTYPGPLPGDVRPQLEVFLAGLSKDFLEKVCMEIETPENGPVEFARGIAFPTIGSFYGAIFAEFQKLAPADFTGQKQLRSPRVGLFPVMNLLDAERAIKQIKDQGEGTSQSPEVGGELGHYYQFGGIFHENTYVRQADGRWAYTGPPAIPFPDFYPMTRIPEGGYVNPAAGVKQALDAFNSTFRETLQKLQDAWDNGSQPSLSASVTLMRDELEPLATAIMQFPLPDGSGGVYGPDFVVT